MRLAFRFVNDGGDTRRSSCKSCLFCDIPVERRDDLSFFHFSLSRAVEAFEKDDWSVATVCFFITAREKCHDPNIVTFPVVSRLPHFYP